jgi:hypothetical protein
VFLVLYAIIAYKMREVGEDAFGIKKELTCCAWSLTISFFAFLALDFFVKPYLPRAHMLALLVGLLFDLCNP